MSEHKSILAEKQPKPNIYKIWLTVALKPTMFYGWLNTSTHDYAPSTLPKYVAESGASIDAETQEILDLGQTAITLTRFEEQYLR